MGWVRERAGQAFLVGIIFVFISVITVMVMLPTINNYSAMTAGNLSASGGDAGTVTFIRLIPLFIVLALAAGIFVMLRLTG